MALIAYDHQANSLPDKVLCQIFNRLDLNSVKNASLTCRRWHNIVFFSEYVDRFRLRIDSLYRPWLHFEREEGWGERVCQQLRHSVAHSERCYRHLRVIIGDDGMRGFQSVWDSLVANVITNVLSLEVRIQEDATTSAVDAVIVTISRMPKLRSLSLVDCTDLHFDEERFPPTVRSKSVQHLKMHTNYRIWVDMPKLVSFDGPLCVLYPPYKSPLVLPKLQSVTLRENDDSFFGPPVMTRLMHVEVLRLKYRVKDWLFMGICGECSALKELYLDSGLFLSDPGNIKHLSKLVHLRRLTLMSIDTKRDVPFDFDLSKLTQLKQLNLPFTVLGPASLVSLPKTLRVLSLRIDNSNEESIIQYITANCPKLTKLRLVYGDLTRGQPSSGTLKALQLLTNLEVLVFVKASLAESFMVGSEAPMYRLRKLRFQNCRVDWNQFGGLQQMCPNLKLLEFPGCNVTLYIQELAEHYRRIRCKETKSTNAAWHEPDDW
uniref:Putative lrr receptor-like serine/threonine-protein kinase n=1 Tax=Anopheles triannulatus TaxID=58253 RepID=A0A2M4AHG9_9DIPT